MLNFAVLVYTQMTAGIHNLLAILSARLATYESRDIVSLDDLHADKHYHHFVNSL